MLQFVRLGLEHLWSQSLHKLVRLTDRLLPITTGWSVKYRASPAIALEIPPPPILLVVIQRIQCPLAIGAKLAPDQSPASTLSLALNLTSD